MRQDESGLWTPGERHWFVFVSARVKEITGIDMQSYAALFSVPHTRIFGVPIWQADLTQDGVLEAQLGLVICRVYRRSRFGCCRRQHLGDDVAEGQQAVA